MGATSAVTWALALLALVVGFAMGRLVRRGKLKGKLPPPPVRLGLAPGTTTARLRLEQQQLSPDQQKLTIEIVKLRIDAWKKSVEVQQHFNDLELRIRN